MPKSKQEFWVKKLGGNAARDKRTITQLKCEGWSVLVVWEREIHNFAKLAECLQKYLNPLQTGYLRYPSEIHWSWILGIARSEAHF